MSKDSVQLFWVNREYTLQCGNSNFLNSIFFLVRIPNARIPHRKINIELVGHTHENLMAIRVPCHLIREHGNMVLTDLMNDLYGATKIQVPGINCILLKNEY